LGRLVLVPLLKPRGAARVVALDSFVWALDFTRADEYWRQARKREARRERRARPTSPRERRARRQH
jgi:hypothetical protein